MKKLNIQVALIAIVSLHGMFALQASSQGIEHVKANIEYINIYDELSKSDDKNEKIKALIHNSAQDEQKREQSFQTTIANNRDIKSGKKTKNDLSEIEKLDLVYWEQGLYKEKSSEEQNRMIAEGYEKGMQDADQIREQNMKEELVNKNKELAFTRKLQAYKQTKATSRNS